MISKVLITKLIMYYSAIQGFDGNLALAVAKNESKLNPTAIGMAHEVGLFQIKPQYSRLSKAELLDPIKNIQEGIRLLSIAKKTCTHKKKNDWLVCFNVGQTGAKKIKHPELFPYVIKVNILVAESK